MQQNLNIIFLLTINTLYLTKIKQNKQLWQRKQQQK